MIIALHKNARTTPAIRAEIAASKESARVLAQRYGVTEATIYKWKKRDTVPPRGIIRLSGVLVQYHQPRCTWGLNAPCRIKHQTLH